MAVNGEVSHNEPHNTFDTILVLDFGSQYTRLLIRRLRDFNVFCEMLPCTTAAQDISKRFEKIKGIILSGSPSSVYDAGAPHVDPAIFTLNVPILGICYGMQEIAWHSSPDNVCAGERREYGHATLNVSRGSTAQSSSLFEGLPHEMVVWMSHGDKLSMLPPGFVTIATTANAPFAGIANEQGNVFGIQFHPEVTHTSNGPQILKNFAVNICHAQQNWTMENFIETEIARIRAVVGEKGQVIGAVSGGVDSSVAAKLVSQAIGNRFHAVFVDNGLLRQREMENVKETLGNHLGVNLTVIDASERFLKELKSVNDPERKRKIIGNLFIETFQDFAKTKAAEATGSEEAGDIEFLLQGTLYPDVIESGQVSFQGHNNASVIKSHHNVGGLLEGMHLKLVEPLRELFKDECRELGKQLGLPDFVINRHPFPGPGLGIRILGEVTADQLKILRQADDIFIQEIRKAGLYDQISQALVALLPVKAVGVMGDKRVHEQVVALRAVVTSDFMTAHAFQFDWNFIEKVSTRIVNEVDGVCRVFYDTTSKPPGTIEFE